MPPPGVRKMGFKRGLKTVTPLMLKRLNTNQSANQLLSIETERDALFFSYLFCPQQCTSMQQLFCIATLQRTLRQVLIAAINHKS